VSGAVRLDDTSVWVHERGSGYPIIVLHAGPGLDHHAFGSYLDPLAQRFRLLFVDQRGQGRSDRVPLSTVTLARLAQDVIMVARALELERYAVLGHGFGACVALQNAVDYPGMASQVVLSGGVPSGRFYRAVARNLEELQPDVVRERIEAALAREGQATTPALFEAFVRDVLPFQFADPVDPRIGTYLKDAAGTVYRPEVHHHMAAAPPIEVEDRLDEVGTPVLAIVGRFDRSCIYAASKAIADGVPDGELALFDASGHMPFVEEPDLFRETVAGFIDRHP
jgi:proline iminopeptidase